MKSLEGTIVYVVKDNKVLLAKKTRVLGIGKWNGYGGGFKSEKDGCFEDCAIREFEEECGGATIKKDYLDKVGYIHFHNGDNFEFKAHIFIANNIDGEPRESEEMIEPTWFPIDKLPSNRTFMDADPLWLPQILSGQKISGHVWYDGNFHLTDRGVEIEIVENFYK